MNGTWTPRTEEGAAETWVARSGWGDSDDEGVVGLGGLGHIGP